MSGTRQPRGAARAAPRRARSSGPHRRDASLRRQFGDPQTRARLHTTYANPRSSVQAQALGWQRRLDRLGWVNDDVSLRGRPAGSQQLPVDLACDVPLETADDLLLAQALGGAPLQVALGALVDAH